tara:strand:+ start:367 stop:492 length:126 start_codon:yes stop_codon:yes gene_type:complete
MIRFVIGVFSGIALVVYQPEVMSWFVTSGMRDNIVAVLNGV